MRSLARLAPYGVLALVVVLAAFLSGGPDTAHAWPRANTLVSNMNQAGFRAFTDLETHDAAQSFTTGSHPTGYFLHSIELRLKAGSVTTVPTVKLFSGSGSGTNVETLEGPAALTANATSSYEFRLRTTPTLPPSTIYFVLVQGSSAQWQNTVAFTEDSDSITGWSIDNGSSTRGRGSTGAFVSDPNFTKLIRVKGARHNNPAGGRRR